MRIWLHGLLAMLGLVVAPAATAQMSMACPWPGPAEFLANRTSPPDSASARVGGALLKVCYSRPHARGRSVMGELVPFGRPWRTGANEPTVLLLTAPVEVAGKQVEAGRYVLLTVPGPEQWSIVVHAATGSTAAEIFQSMEELGRGSVAAGQTEAHVEAFTIRGLDGERRGALILEWERTRIEIPVLAR